MISRARICICSYVCLRLQKTQVTGLLKHVGVILGATYLLATPLKPQDPRSLIWAHFHSGAACIFNRPRVGSLSSWKYLSRRSTSDGLRGRVPPR